MKPCPRCKKRFPPSGFYQKQSRCKSCVKLRVREWEKKNRTRSNDAKKRWQLANPEKRWNRAHPEKFREALRNSYQKDRSKYLKRCRAYYKTPAGFLTSTFSSMKVNSIARGHQPPKFTKQELGEWIFKQKKFWLTWNSYILGGGQKNERPSVDRLNARLGYSFKNIRLVTWKENNSANHSSLEHSQRAKKTCEKRWAEYGRRKRT